jgi:hypothetical protein
MFNIYEHDYTEYDEDPFDTLEQAADYILGELPHEDFVYLVGDDSGISAIVFQGTVYLPAEPVAKPVAPSIEKPGAQIDLFAVIASRAGNKYPSFDFLHEDYLPVA